MFIGADLRSRYVLSTQNKIICKALGFKNSASPARPPGPPSPLGRGGRSPPTSQLHPGLSIACARLPAPRSGARLLLASAPTVGGNECLAVLVPARLSITLFTCLQGNLLPLVRWEKLTLCAGGRERARPPPPAPPPSREPRGLFACAEVTEEGAEGRGEGKSGLKVSHSPQYRPRGPPHLTFERSFGVRAQPGGARAHELGK